VRRSSSLLQFPFQLVAICDMQLINLFELGQQFQRLRYVVTIAFFFGNDLTLPGDMSLTFGDMATGLLKMLQCRSPVHHHLNAR
jgi:hypothetical protein